MASLYTKEHFLELLKEKGRNDLILTGDYVNANIPTTFKCSDENCGCEWETKPVYVLHGKGGCPKCRKRKLSEFHKLPREEYEKRLLKIRPTLHIEGEFNRGYAPVTLCCDKGHRWNVP